MSAFLRVSKALWHSSVNWKGTSLARRLLRGLAICEKFAIDCNYYVFHDCAVAFQVSSRR